MATRTLATEHRLLRFGVFELDLRSKELRKRGLKVKVQEQPCHILGVLLSHAGEIVSREELRNRLWPSDTFVDFDHSLNTAIMRLREVLGDSSENPIFIETISRRGYRFIAPVEEFFPQPVDGAPQPSPLGRPEIVGPRAISKGEAQFLPRTPILSEPIRRPFLTALRRILALTLAAVPVVAIGFIALRSRKSPIPTQTRPQLKSVVVIPLENLSGDKEQDYFADGMTDELIASLAKIKELRVISRTSAMEYKGTHKPLSEIAKDLQVDAVVEGTILRAGDRVRITAELVQVSTDRHLWADTYEGDMNNILALQSRVAAAIVNEIRVNLTPEEQQRLTSPPVVNPQAYEDYLKGRYYWNKRSEEGLIKAVGYFQSATEKDPQYALAYAGLADCYDLLATTIIGSMPTGEAAPRARGAALRALEIDGSLVDAQLTLASIKLNYDWDWRGAESAFKQVVAMNPNHATAHQRYSLYLAAMGRHPESFREIQRALELDPLSISINFSYGWRLYFARQYDQAIQQLKATIDLDPDFVLAHLVLGQAYEEKGQYAQALEELKKAVELSPNSPLMLAGLGRGEGMAGNNVEAWRVISRLDEMSKRQYVSPFFVALVYTGVGENRQALDRLEKAYKDRSNGLIFLAVDPELDRLRSLPQFQELQRRMGLGS
jgi:TolB-like protein/DNA-binding winged helix-turn-helix (wHTH) protein/Tfp pilus assembly protein PilF